MANTTEKSDTKVDLKTQGERLKALELAVSTIEKQFGKGSIMRLGSSDSLHKDIETISTGALSLDIALGIGGLPRGRIVEIFGPESSGKTTIALSAIAQAQKKGGVVAFFLCLSNCRKCNCCFTRRFWAKNFYDSSTW